MKKAFTLIELLVVIVIVAILVALLMTGVGAARRAANRTRASVEVKSLATAIEKYYYEYRRWPPTAVDAEKEKVEIWGDMARMLQGEDVPAGSNPKKMQFIQFQRYESPSATDKPVNPWFGSAKATAPDACHYFFKVDRNLDNKVSKDSSGTGSPPTNDVRRMVIVWTMDWDREALITSWDE